MEDRKHLLIDIEEVLRKKAPNKKFPKFLVNFMKARIHQDQLNDAIIHAKEPVGLGFFDEALKYVNITYNVEGLENIDPQGRYIIAGNHPFGGPEALIIGSALGKIFGTKFKFPVNNILSQFHPLEEFFVGVNTTGGVQNREILTNMRALFDGDDQVVMYPAGKCARLRNGKVTELEWKKMFISEARRTKRDVVPMFIVGRNSRLFYFVTALCEALHMKVNVGMFMLVDELFKTHPNKCFRMIIGKPIKWETFDKSRSDAEWAAYVREICINLEK